MAPTPRALLEQLASGQSLPGFPPEAVERARALAAAPAGAPAADVEALPEPLALAVLEASVRAHAAALPAALCTSGHKGLARAAKGALYRLRASGVSVPEPTAPAPAPAAPAPAAAAEQLPAVATAMSGTGEVALLVPRQVRGGIEALQFLLDDETGIREVSHADLPRGGYLKLLKQLRRDTQLPSLELSLEEARAEVEAAAGRNLASRTPFPQGLDTVLRHLQVQPRTEEEPLPPPLPEDERLSYEGHTLHEQPELEGWLPSEGELRLLAERLAAVETSPLALSEAQRAEQLVATVRAAAHAYFTQPIRRVYARRLWWMARFFERTGRAHPAEVARAEARRLFHGALEPYPRFAEGLFEKVLQGPAQAMAGTGAGAGAGAPAAAGPQEAPPVPASERRSPGGIILP